MGTSIFGLPMTLIYKSFIFILIRLSITLSLIFFAFTMLSCGNKKHKAISITWENDRATGLEIPKALLQDVDEDSIEQLLQVRLKNAGGTPMMGGYTFSGDVIRFSPLIPLSRGLQYSIFFRNTPVGEVTVPLAGGTVKPELQAIYPSNDTVPENLLKFYFHFSSPMRAGEWHKHIFLMAERNDTLHDVFLDLQPELWNREGNTLTLWLDPGRIKRELIPNQQYGNPLMKGKQYTLVVNETWKDVQDRPLEKTYRKSFTVGLRDSLLPDPLAWHLSLPDAGTRDPLLLAFPEPLDYYLLQETVRISNKYGDVNGLIQVAAEEKSVRFIPDEKWKTGQYRLRVSPILEDLAGNNLQRPFDRDIRDAQAGRGTTSFERSFKLDKR